jgi:hypothetical protein
LCGAFIDVGTIAAVRGGTGETRRAFHTKETCIGIHTKAMEQIATAILCGAFIDIQTMTVFFRKKKARRTRSTGEGAHCIITGL